MDSINYLQRQVVYRKKPPPGLPHPRAFLSAGCPTDLACQPRNSAPPTSLHFVRTYTHLFPPFFSVNYTPTKLSNCTETSYGCIVAPPNYTPTIHRRLRSPRKARTLTGRLRQNLWRAGYQPAQVGMNVRGPNGYQEKVSQPKSEKVTMYSWCIVETTNYTPAIH